jgi:hypothetical protein
MARIDCPHDGCNGYIVSVTTTHDTFKPVWRYDLDSQEWRLRPQQYDRDQPTFTLECSERHQIHKTNSELPADVRAGLGLADYP